MEVVGTMVAYGSGRLLSSMAMKASYPPRYTRGKMLVLNPMSDY